MQRDDYEPHPNDPWSWTGGHIPCPVERKEVTEHATYYYWHDANGDLWYTTDCGLEFAREMEAAQKKKK